MNRDELIHSMWREAARKPNTFLDFQGIANMMLDAYDAARDAERADEVERQCEAAKAKHLEERHQRHVRHIENLQAKLGERTTAMVNLEADLDLARRFAAKQQDRADKAEADAAALRKANASWAEAFKEERKRAEEAEEGAAKAKALLTAYHEAEVTGNPRVLVWQEGAFQAVHDATRAVSPDGEPVPVSEVLRHLRDRAEKAEEAMRLRTAAVDQAAKAEADIEAARAKKAGAVGTIGATCIEAWRDFAGPTLAEVMAALREQNERPAYGSTIIHAIVKPRTVSLHSLSGHVFGSENPASIIRKIQQHTAPKPDPTPAPEQTPMDIIASLRSAVRTLRPYIGGGAGFTSKEAAADEADKALDTLEAVLAALLRKAAETKGGEA